MKKILIFTIIIILIPFFIIFINKNDEIINKLKYGIYSNKVVKVKIIEEDKIESIPLEEYVLGVVAGEMPASFNLEALKAQAVASRTYVLKHINSNNTYDVDDSTNYQVYINNDDMRKKWKDKYEENFKKIKLSVDETRGEVLLYDNKLIDAMFFSTSNGYTENSEDVFKNNLPYLKSVESKWDQNESPVFSSTEQVTKEEFLFNLGFDKDDKIDITDIKRTNTGRLISMKVNGKTIESKTIRNAFNLKSTSFKINIKDNIVTFLVNGYGHGVGLSQYGSNGMANEGFNYKEILLHYYSNCEIKKIN